MGLYDLLACADPSPVVELNRAVAVAMRDGPSAGLVLIDALLERGQLTIYNLAHAARADLLRQLGRTTYQPTKGPFTGQSGWVQDSRKAITRMAGEEGTMGCWTFWSRPRRLSRVG